MYIHHVHTNCIENGSWAVIFGNGYVFKNKNKNHQSFYLLFCFDAPPPRDVEADRNIDDKDCKLYRSRSNDQYFHMRQNSRTKRDPLTVSRATHNDVVRFNTLINSLGRVPLFRAIFGAFNFSNIIDFSYLPLIASTSDADDSAVGFVDNISSNNPQADHAPYCIQRPIKYRVWFIYSGQEEFGCLDILRVVVCFLNEHFST